ncbi:AI-2E family transporter [Virgisporangium aurantiacum]|uniref:AI-2E family transporter n=1 Tax=Virgisporangium aurantiacum TaxID=175570 RepID=A0A8J3ZEM0_9ACTN|nr:AI-2E family transporter [Virgisporangium aurantiacum]GIJ62506.1 AI-2E family transporter [Virgisporangium aurantiacum]
MIENSDLAGEPDSRDRSVPTPGSDTPPGGAPVGPTRVPRLAVWAWSFVGVVAAAIIVVAALAAVSEIVLPLTLAAVLAVIFKPAAGVLQRHRFKPTLAAGLIVLGLLALLTGVVVATVRGVIEQADQIGALTGAALDTAAEQLDALGVDAAALDDARAATGTAAPMITGGVLTHLVSGIGTLIGFASGVILGSLVMYYLLKDGNRLRHSLIAQFEPSLRDDVDGFIGDSIRLLRDYGKGRTVMSAIVSVVIGIAALLLGLPLVFTIMVVNFVGGYIPYIGAFLGGGLAVIVALGDGGLSRAAVMLVVVLASNLVLENFVEPKVMGRSLDIHPLVVLVVTALGGLVGGIVGLILAVPAYVIARTAITRFRSRGLVERVADRAEPTVQRLLQ